MTKDPHAAQDTGFDRILAFTLPDRDTRGRAVRLGPVLDDILSAHAYPPAIKHVLAEALVLTALMGGLLKQDGDQLTLQAQAKGGVIDLLVCDFRAGALRGYLQHDAEAFDNLGAQTDLRALFGDGHLAITFDIAETGQRYQGIVPLEGSSLSEAIEGYFAQSEQLPTLIRTAVRSTPDSCVAGGMLVQHLPEGEDGRERMHVRMDHPQWEHVAILSATVDKRELTDETVALETLLWRLFHEEREVRVERGTALQKGCRCTAAHFEDVLSRFSKEDRADMKDDDGVILVDCAFCSKVFPIQD